MSNRIRIDRKLRIEELEPRTAPVTLTVGQSFTFDDAHNNRITVTLSGRNGSVVLLDNQGNDPNNSDIATAVFSGADGSTSFLLDVVTPGTSGAVLGNMTANGQALGNILVEGSIGSLMAKSVKQIVALPPKGVILSAPTYVGSVTLDTFGGGSSIRTQDLGIAPGGLGGRSDYTAGFGISGYESVALGDFNGDGRPDAATVDPAAGMVVIWTGSTSGALTLSGLFQTDAGTDGAPVFLATGDMNKDGKLDLIIANSAGNNVAVLLGRGDATFDPALTRTVGNGPMGLAMGDFNKDGFLDVATVNIGSGDLNVLIGIGDGTLGPPAPYGLGTGTTGAAPWAVATGDLNGDGHLDLVTANSGANNVSVLLGSVTGVFGTAATFGTGAGATAPRNLALADFTRDGRPDIVAANYGTNNLALLINNGTGGFGTLSVYASGVASPKGLAIGDMNRDGNPDAVVSGGSTAGGVAVLFGNLGSPGSLSAPLTYGTPTGAVINSVALGFLNTDTALDVAAPSANLPILSTFFSNIGGGGLTVAGAVNGKLNIGRDLNGLVASQGGDVSTTIVIGNDVGPTGGIYSGGTGGEIRGTITIGHDLLGTISSVGRTRATIKVGGNIGTSAAIRSGDALTGKVTVGGDLAGKIQSAKNGIRNQIAIQGPGGILSTGSISAAGSGGSLLAKISVPNGGLAGRIEANGDIMQSIAIGGAAGITYSGRIMATNGVMIGQLSILNGDLNGTINTGRAISLPILVPRGGFDGTIQTGLSGIGAFGGLILSSGTEGELSGTISAATDIGAIRIGGDLSGTITTPNDFVRGIRIGGDLAAGGQLNAGGSILSGLLNVAGTIAGDVTTRQYVSRSIVTTYSYREMGREVQVKLDNLRGESFANALITIGGGVPGFQRGEVSVDVGTNHLRSLSVNQGVSFQDITAGNIDRISAAGITGLVSLNTFDATDRIELTTPGGRLGGIQINGSDLAGQILNVGLFGPNTTAGAGLIMPTWTMEYLTKGPTRADVTPSISHGHVAWVSGAGANSEIYYYDGNGIRQITANNTPDSAPSLYVDPNTGKPNLAWVQYDGSRNQIMWWDGVTTRALTNSTGGDNKSPSAFGGRVVWEGPNPGVSGQSQIFFWDNGLTSLIPSASTGGTNTGPSLWYDTLDVMGGTHGARIAWTGNDGTQNQIMYWNGNLGTTTQITTDIGSTSSNASITRGWLTWKTSTGAFSGSIRYVQLGADGAPIGATQGAAIAGVSSFLASDTAPKVAVNPIGQPIFVWHTLFEGIQTWDGNTNGSATTLATTGSGDRAPNADNVDGGRFAMQHAYGSQTNIEIVKPIPLNVTGTLTAGTFLKGRMDIGGSILSSANFAATTDIEANITVRGTAGIGTAITVGRNLSGSILLTNAGITQGFSVGNAFTGTIGTANGSISGPVTLGRTFSGSILATNGDIQSNINIPGDMTAGQITVVNGNITGNISILGSTGSTSSPGNLNGLIGVTGGNIAGNIRVNGSVGTAGSIVAAMTSGDTRGNLVGNITGFITVGDSLGAQGSTAGTITATNNIGLLGGTSAVVRVGNTVWGGISSVTRAINSPIVVGNDLNGLITTGAEMLGDITIGRNVGAGGAIRSGAQLVGAISVGNNMSGNISAVDTMRSVIRINNDLNGTISMGSPVASTSATIIVGHDIGTSGAIIAASSVIGAVTVGHDILAGGMIIGQTLDGAITVNNNMLGMLLASGGSINGQIRVGNNVGTSGTITATGNITAGIAVGNNMNGSIVSSSSSIGGGTFSEISIGRDLNGPIAAASGAVAGIINVGRHIGAGGSIQARLNLEGTITLGSGGNMLGSIGATTGDILAAITIPGELRGNIAAANGNIRGGLNIGQILNPGVIETNLADGIPFSWVEVAGGAAPKVISMSSLTGGNIGRAIVSGAFGTSGLGAMADITAADTVGSLVTRNVQVHNILAPQIGVIDVGSDVAGTIGLGVSGPTDGITVSGNINALMITAGDLAGTVNAVNIGTIGVGAGQLSGRVFVSGNLGGVEVEGVLSWETSGIPVGAAIENSLPSLYNGTVAWQGRPDTTGTPQIYFYNGATVQQISSGAATHGDPSLFNGKIAWLEAGTAGAAILYWDGASIIQIASSTAGDVANPSLAAGTAGNPFLAWEQDGDIYYWEGDFDTAGLPINIQALTTDGVAVGDSTPAVSNGTIGWIREGPLNPEVWFWNGTSMDRVASTATTGTTLSNSGGDLTWDGVAGVTRVVFFWDGSSVVTANAPHGSSVYDFAPSTANGHVAWHQQSSGVNRIHYWNGLADALLTPDSDGHTNPSLNVNQITSREQIAWQNSDGSLTMATQHRVALTGMISVGGSVGPVLLNGDMPGTIGTGIFGDVTIFGSFEGLLSALQPGVGNKLTVTGSTAGGIITPPNAFSIIDPP